MKTSRVRSTWRFILAAALLPFLAACGGGPWGGAGDPEPAEETAGPEADAPPLDPDLTLAGELLERDAGALFGGEPAGTEPGLLEAIREDFAAVDFSEDPEGLELAESLFGENPLLSQHNPLVTRDDRQQWLAAAIKNVGRDMALDHLRDEVERLSRGEVDRAHWYEHVAACEKVCNRIVSGLLHVHVRRVRELPHRLVLFGNNSFEVAPESGATLAGLLSELDRQPLPGRTELLLVGRASKSGAKGFNRRLSEQRVDAVRAELLRQGVKPDRVRGFGLGFEPPQITEEVARAYGLDPSLPSEVLNQSVLVVAYLHDAGGGGPAGAGP